MKNIYPYCLLLTLAGVSIINASAQTNNLLPEVLDSDTLVVSDPVVLFENLEQPAVNEDIVNLSFVPRVFAGYRKLHTIPEYSSRNFYGGQKGFEIINGDLSPEEEFEEALVQDTQGEILQDESLATEQEEINSGSQLPNLLEYHRPEWFQNALLSRRAQEDLQYEYMIDNPEAIEYAYWDLPTPPVLLVEDRSFLAFINKQEVPEVDPDDAVIPEIELKKKYWLHKVGAQLQFSQAYVSPNWYQGGNNYLALLLGFNWNVQLNQVFHPNILFQSDLSYKLALSSNPKGYMHRYTISEDNFQYNLNVGLKAIKSWYYSLNLQFKTQLLNNFEQDSEVRTASFLSPGDLNIGLGMSYNHKNKLETFQYTLTISPLSYNLKTCISDKVDHATYSIPWDKKVKNEIGSNIEFNMDWKITTNISYKTRVFMFTDYKYYLGDWQNTISFDINKFLSTQIFVHLRYDGSTESYNSKWKKFMMREILSFGLSYTFSTKP